MRKERELPFFAGLGQHRVQPPRLVGQQPRHQQQPQHNRRGLDHVGQRHRPHPPKHRVDRHDHRPNDDRLVQRQPGKQHVDHQPQRRQLRARPAKIRRRNPQRRQDLHHLPIPLVVVVANRQQFHPVERAGKKERHQDQAERRPERVARDKPQPLVGELRRDRQHRLGPEPRGEHAGEIHVQRQRPPRHHEVFRIFHPQRRIQPHRHRRRHVHQHAQNQHLMLPGAPPHPTSTRHTHLRAHLPTQRLNTRSHRHPASLPPTPLSPLHCSVPPTRANDFSNCANTSSSATCTTPRCSTCG